MTQNINDGATFDLIDLRKDDTYFVKNTLKIRTKEEFTTVC